MTTLAWIPFLEPLNALQDFWYLLLIPLSFGISVIYKALRMPSLTGFWRQVAMMTIQIVLAMIGLTICLIFLVQVIVPMLPIDR